jgi:alpha-ketoglutarate-dependent taurine dioxygenase
MSSAATLSRPSALQAARRLDLNKNIGTELRGVELLSLSDEGVAEVKQLLAERGVLVFRDQPMSLQQQIELGRRFGKLHVHPAFADKAHPEALRIHADADSSYAAGEAWHTDVSCDLEPPAISMLRIEVVPSGGGETAFASMYKAWDDLSKPHAGNAARAWRPSTPVTCRIAAPTRAHPRRNIRSMSIRWSERTRSPASARCT